MNVVTKRDVLSLYRKILRKGNQTIKYSNIDYFKRRIREEFEMANDMSIGDKKKRNLIREKMYRKGEEFLNNNNGGII